MKRKRKSPASQILPLLRDRIFLNTGKFKMDSFTVDCMNKKKKQNWFQYLRRINKNIKFKSK